MYNVNKGGNTFEESEILEPIHNCLRELLEYQRQGKPITDFTDHDVIAITLLYSMIMGDRLVSYLKDQRISLEAAQAISEYFANVIQTTSSGMAQVNVKDYYKERNK